MGGRDSSVDTETRYGLNGSGLGRRWGRDFPHPSRPAPRPTQPPFLWGKAAGGWRWPPTSIFRGVKHRYSYTSTPISVPARNVTGVTLTFTFTIE